MRNFLNGRQLKVNLDCFPCFLKQTVIALNLGTADEALKIKIIKAVLEDVKNAKEERSPAHATSFMHRRIRDMLGGDPFSGIKSSYNKKALEYYAALKEEVRNSPDRLLTATKLAVAGNVIDFGLFTTVDMDGTIKKSLRNEFDAEEYESYKREIMEAGKILYLLDNAGEVVFDRLLIEELMSMGIKVTAVVKGAAIINDCTLKDAEEAGLSGVCGIMDNGSDFVGTNLETTSASFNKAFGDERSLVISKGQGNFETLMCEKRKIFFLFQAKCDVLARFLEIPRDSMLLAGNLKVRHEGN